MEIPQILDDNKEVQSNFLEAMHQGGGWTRMDGKPVYPGSFHHTTLLSSKIEQSFVPS